MAGQADLGDSRVLDRLLHSSAALPALLARALDDARDDASRRIRAIEQAAEEARDAVRVAERAAEESDDDEAGYCDDRLEEARARMARIEWALDDLRGAWGDYRGAARDLENLDRTVLAAGRSFLGDRLAAIAEYSALDPRAHVAAGVSNGAPSRVSSQGPAASRSDSADLPDLPPGFAWIPVAEIPQSDGGEPLQWKKIDRSVMEAGLRAFAQDLLPRMRAGTATRDELAALDRADGRDTGGLIRPDNLANLHDVFFGSDPIAVSPLSTGSYDISSGRHRIEIARALGWTHIPARLLEGA